MARIKLYIIVLLFCNTFLANAKNYADTTVVKTQLSKTLLGKFSNFYVDNFGNIFLITQSQQIKKYNANLDSVGIFNDIKRYGNIYSIDVSNPLKALVYYKDYASIIVLDRLLNNRNSIALRQQNFYQVGAIAQSYDNNIWLFDELEYKLKKIDETGKLLFESADFRLVFDKPMPPTNIIDNNGLLYLYHPKQGFTVFDYYGAFKNQYPIYQWQHVQVQDGWLLGFNHSFLFKFQIQQQQFQTIQLNIPIETAQKIVWLQNNCYMLTSNGLYIYKVL